MKDNFSEMTDDYIRKINDDDVKDIVNDLVDTVTETRKLVIGLDLDNSDKSYYNSYFEEYIRNIETLLSSFRKLEVLGIERDPGLAEDIKRSIRAFTKKVEELKDDMVSRSLNSIKAEVEVILSKI